jgi:uncharacterized protein YndB with AHSA1/START domain
MRTILIIAGVVLLLAVAGLFLLLPRQVSLSQDIAIKAPSGAVLRALTEKEKWQRWWPVDNTALKYHAENFNPGSETTNSMLVDIQAGDTAVQGLLMTISVTNDSTIVSWEATLPAGANPFQRISTWMEARKLKRQLAAALTRLKAFSEDPRNVYGIAVKEVKVTTPYLVALKGESTLPLSTQEVYARIDELRTYIHSKGARETAPPMLNIQTEDSTLYQFMVALPVDRLLPGKGPIEQKRMVMGKLLEAEVRGGDSTVQRGMAALENYRRDYRRASPAIPYASLVTDRTKEPDTAKWITQLYCPVF